MCPGNPDGDIDLTVRGNEGEEVLKEGLFSLDLRRRSRGKSKDGIFL